MSGHPRPISRLASGQRDDYGRFDPAPCFDVVRQHPPKAGIMPSGFQQKSGRNLRQAGLGLAFVRAGGDGRGDEQAEVLGRQARRPGVAIARGATARDEGRGDEQGEFVVRSKIDHHRSH